MCCTPSPYEIVTDTRIGGIERHYLGGRKDINMLIPDDFIKCVTILGIPTRGPSGQETNKWGGTAFAVSVPSEVAPHERRYNFLVTARHVVEKLEGNKPCIRVNTKKDNNSEIIAIDDVSWWYHPAQEPQDLYVDVAVTPWTPPEESELVTIPIAMFLTGEALQKEGIGLGNEVFITGLFSRVAGKTKNIPIVRTGNIAMMPSEPIDTENGDMEAYLIESRSIGGLSGSPVFVIQDSYSYSMSKGQFGRPLYLLGLIHGHWPTSPHNIEDSISKDEEQINMGIAIVVPAKKILEVINQPDLVEMRKEADKEYKRLFLPIADKDAFQT